MEKDEALKEHRPDAVNDDERKIHADDRSFDYGGIVSYLLVAITAVLCSFDAVSGSLLFFRAFRRFQRFLLAAVWHQHLYLSCASIVPSS